MTGLISRDPRIAANAKHAHQWARSITHVASAHPPKIISNVDDFR
jgi:hypothetical protein